MPAETPRPQGKQDHLKAALSQEIDAVATNVLARKRQTSSPESGAGSETGESEHSGLTQELRASRDALARRLNGIVVPSFVQLRTDPEKSARYILQVIADELQVRGLDPNEAGQEAMKVFLRAYTAIIAARAQSGAALEGGSSQA